MDELSFLSFLRIKRIKKQKKMEKEGVERKEVGPHNREMEKRHVGISEAKITQSVGCKNMMHRGGGVLFSVCV